jgi:hypothetical protein
MKKLLLLFLIIMGCTSEKEQTTFDFETVFEKSQGTETATYDETIAYFRNLSKAYPEISIDSIGMTDAGKPLHIVTLNPDKVFDFSEIRTNVSFLSIMAFILGNLTVLTPQCFCLEILWKEKLLLQNIRF